MAEKLLRDDLFPRISIPSFPLPAAQAVIRLGNHGDLHFGCPFGCWRARRRHGGFSGVAGGVPQTPARL